MPYIKLEGFMPDADPMTPGSLMDVDLMVPTLNGMRSLPGDSDAGVASLASSARSIVPIIKLDNTLRTFAGTANKLFELSTSTWTERTRGTGGDYSTTAAARWTFAQYNNISLASQKGNVIQQSPSAGFTALTSAPQAVIVEVVLDFVFALNTNDATFGDSPNRWWCSAAGDPGSWTANIATQAASGLLIDSPGPITAGKRLGSNIVVYKPSSMYIGQYVGPPLIWGFTLIPGEGLGTFSPYSVVDIETAHLFIGKDNIYLYDGSRPVPIATNRVADFFFSNLRFAARDYIVGHHDKTNWIVYWWYPSIFNGDTTVLDRFICYNYRSDKWGAGIKTIQFPFEYFEGGISYDDVGTYYATYDAIPMEGYDTLFASSGTGKFAYLDTNKKVQRLTAMSGSSSYVTGQFGVDGGTTLLSRIRPRFKMNPDTGTQAHFFRNDIGEATVTSSAGTTLTRGAFDYVFSTRWHQVKHAYTGDTEVTGLDIEVAEDGLE